jgi:hypothetical protein
MTRDLWRHATKFDRTTLPTLRTFVSSGIGGTLTIDGVRFRQIDGFERYAVSDTGEIYSDIRAGRFLSKTLSPQGYPYVSLLADDGKPIKQLVHRLVASAFIPNPNGLKIVNHKDGVKTNSSDQNLEWCTYTENNDHARATGLSLAIGETHWAAKLTNAQVVEIRNLGKTGLFHKDIAARFGVGRKCITKILNNQIRKGAA